MGTVKKSTLYQYRLISSFKSSVKSPEELTPTVLRVTLVFRPRTDYEKRVRAQARAMTVPE